MYEFVEDIEPILDFALRLHDLGFSIVPVPPHGKSPAMPWKQYQTERASKRQLLDWGLEEYPHFNYAVITGKLSGIICLDADNGTAEAMIAKHCPATPMLQVSGSGRGRHHIYRYPLNGPVPNRTNLKVHGQEAQGLDVRGDGGLFIGPGSLHRITEQPYLEVVPWTKEMLEAVPVFDPAWLGMDTEPARAVTELKTARPDIATSRRQRYAREFLKEKEGSVAGQGKAEKYCFALASALIHGLDMSHEEAEEPLVEWGEKDSNQDAQGNYYPWKRSELRRKLEDAAKQEDPQGRPRGYLLERYALVAASQDVEEMFRKKAHERFKTDTTELKPGLPTPEDPQGVNLKPLHSPEKPTPKPAQGEPELVAAAEPEPQPAEISEDDRFRSDPRTAYLWKDNHGNDFNVWPCEQGTSQVGN